MEWIETTAKTLDDAKDLALDRLGWPPTRPSSTCSRSPEPACLDAFEAKPGFAHA